MAEPNPDPGNSPPEEWKGGPVDDSELLQRALDGEFDSDGDDE